VWEFAALALILLGLVFRLAQFAVNRSLWFDEALLVLNVVHRPAADLLLHPLANNQAAPVLFLVAERAAVMVLGNQDWVLRAVPLLGGCAALFLMGLLSGRILGGASALLALALFATSEHLVYYASEVKPYSTDAATCLLLLVTISWLWERDAEPERYAVLCGVGAVAVWLSYPAVFVLAGIGLVLALDLVTRKSWRELTWLAFSALVWIGNLAVLYVVNLREASSRPSLVSYWQNFFMPMPPWRAGPWLVRTVQALIENPVGLSPVALGIALTSLGCVSLAVRRWKWGAVLVLPLIGALFASGFRKYPFGDRLMLFAVPILFLLAAEGVHRVWLTVRRVRWLASIVWAGLAMWLLVPALASAVGRLSHPILGEHIKPALAFVRSRAKPTDLIYVYYAATPAFDYYAVSFGLDTLAHRSGHVFRTNPDGYLREIDDLRGCGRVWFLFSHVYAGAAGDERRLMLRHLDRTAKMLAGFEGSGAYVYLYQLGGGAPAPP
jgi:hypothetical protein